MRSLIPFFAAAVLLLAPGCSFWHRSRPAKTVPESAVPVAAPTAAPGGRASRAEFTALVERAAVVRSLSLYVDACVEATAPDGRVFGIERNRALGEIVAVACRQEFATRGFDLRGSVVTSVGLGFGSLAPTDVSTRQNAPFYVSDALADGERRLWFETIFAAIRNYADGRGAPASIRCATYLNANTPRLLGFIALTGNEFPGDVRRSETRAALHALIVDSETGRLLWSGTTAHGGRTLDEARLNRLAADLLRHVPNIVPPVR